MLDELTRILDKGVEDGAFPAAQSAIVLQGDFVHSSAHGTTQDGVATTRDSIFDVASVTKAAATSLATAVLCDRGALELNAPLRRFLGDSIGVELGELRVRELLAHSSGLLPWRPFFASLPDDPSLETIFAQPNRRDPRTFELARQHVHRALAHESIGPSRGERVYSDLGFILLGAVVESACDIPLDRACRDLVFEPLGLEDIGFAPLDRSEPIWLAARQVLGTGKTRPREPAPGQESLYQVHDQAPLVVPGEVDDDNAYIMGGVAGHAGLFTNAATLARLAWLILEELDGANRLGAGESLRTMTRADTETRGSRRGLGFDMPSDEGSAAGSLLGKKGARGAIGHLGFTGCSFWLDLDRGLAISLLTNRTLPGRDNIEGIRRLRPFFHDTACRCVDELIGMGL